jgi:hypothetical protein
MTQKIKIAVSLVREITPKCASEMLKNTGVYPDLSRWDPDVELFRLRMLAGEWELRWSDPIRVNRAGRVADGRHRLWAVVRLGRPVEFVVEYEG